MAVAEAAVDLAAALQLILIATAAQGRAIAGQDAEIERSTQKSLDRYETFRSRNYLRSILAMAEARRDADFETGDWITHPRTSLQARRTAPAQEDAGAARLRGPRAIVCAATTRHAPEKGRRLSALSRTPPTGPPPAMLAPQRDCRM